MKSSDDDDGDETTVMVDPPLWKCYWTKMQLMMLLSGSFMLVGSLLHLACPLILIFIIDYVESKHTIGKSAGNVTLPKVCSVSVSASCSVIFVLIYFLVLVLVLVFQLFFRFSLHHFFVFVLVLPIIFYF